MTSYRFGIRSIPYLFAFITVIAYGLLLRHTGFYWDDWPFAWIARFYGPGEFFQAFTGVRPFLGPIFFVTTSLIPPVPIYWQIFALVIRFFSGLSVWFVLSQVWPRYKRQALVASLFFLVFPGYSQHWVAFTHINQEWIPFLFYLVSFGFTARAMRNPEKFRSSTIYALLLTVLGVFPTEYFIGLEPLRFMFIWVIVSEVPGTFKQRSIQTLKLWGPYLLVWLGNVAWLAYFYTIGSYDSYAVEAATAPLTLFQLPFSMLDALWKAGIYAWGQIIFLVAQTITAPSSLLSLGLIGVTFILLLSYLTKLDLPHIETRTFAIPALLIGAAGIMLGRVPSFAADLPLKLQSSFDRFMISMMLGGSLMVLGLIELMIVNARARTILSALLIALGIGQQFFNANIFRRDWEKQQELLWQMAWRVPGLQPNTAILTDELLLDYETDLSFTAPMNWLYTSEYVHSSLPYGLVAVKIRLGGSLPALEQNIPIYVGLRRAGFYGSTSQAIVIYKPKSGCLRVLDPMLGDQSTYADLSTYLVDAIPLSDTNRIIVDATQPKGIPFLAEPEHTWCYYYTKAELARQKNDWQAILRLMGEAETSGYQPVDPFEWLPYMEAQAMTGNIDAAEKMSVELMRSEKRIGQGVCHVWRRVQAQVPAGSAAESRVNNILFQFACEK